MNSEGIRFDRNFRTVFGQTGLSKQCRPRSDAAERRRTHVKTFTEAVMYFNLRLIIISPRTGVYMPVCYHKRQNLTAFASEDDLSLHWSHVLLS